MKTTYVEGPKAKENFDRTMIALFQVKKMGRSKKIKNKIKKDKN